MISEGEYVADLYAGVERAGIVTSVDDHANGFVTIFWNGGQTTRIRSGFLKDADRWDEHRTGRWVGTHSRCLRVLEGRHTAAAVKAHVWLDEMHNMRSGLPK